MRQTVRDLTIVGLVAAVMLLTNLGAARLWDRDEPRNAGCAVEMLARGDWVTPVFNNELRAHKPVLLYWLIMLAYEMFGVTEFAARFWSAVIGILTCLATYDIGRRLFDRSAGCWAGVILSTCLAFDMSARAATPDALLVGCTTLTFWFFVRGAFPLAQTANRTDLRRPDFSTSWSQSVLMFACMGLGVLAKGPVGCLLPTAVIGLFLLIVRCPPALESRDSARRRDWLRYLSRLLAPNHLVRTAWSMRPLTAVLAILSVAAPWYVSVGLRTDGEFLREFFLDHNLGRATSSREGHHGPFLLYYVGAMLVGFFPWSAFAVPVARSAMNRVRDGHPWRCGFVFTGCWIAVYVVLFSFAATKLPSYIAPCYPALALLAGCWLRGWVSGESPVSRSWMRAALVVWGTIGMAWMILWPWLTRSLFPGELGLAMLGATLLAGAVAAWRWLHQGRSRRAAYAMVATSMGFVLGLFAVAVPSVDRHQQNHLVLQAIQQAGENPQVGAFGLLEPSWVFYGGRPIVELTAPGQKTQPNVREFFGTGEERFVLTTDRHWEHLKRKLPDSAGIVAECPLFLKKDRLLLIGRAKSDGRVKAGVPQAFATQETNPPASR